MKVMPWQRHVIDRKMNASHTSIDAGILVKNDAIYLRLLV